MFGFVLYSLHVLVCIFLILVVLLQQGKGADLSVFGGGGTMTAFGARGAATLLHKLTVISFVLFIVTTLSIGVLQGGGIQSSVMSSVAPGDDETTAAVNLDDESATEQTEGATAIPEENATAGPDQEADSGEGETALPDTELPSPGAEDPSSDNSGGP